MDASIKMLLTFEEVAELCSVSKRSVSRAVRAGELRAMQAPGTRGHRGKRIPRQEVESWMQRQRGIATQVTTNALGRLRERRGIS